MEATQSKVRGKLRRGEVVVDRALPMNNRVQYFHSLLSYVLQKSQMLMFKIKPRSWTAGGTPAPSSRMVDEKPKRGSEASREPSLLGERAARSGRGGWRGGGWRKQRQANAKASAAQEQRQVTSSNPRTHRKHQTTGIFAWLLIMVASRCVCHLPTMSIACVHHHTPLAFEWQWPLVYHLSI